MSKFVYGDRVRVVRGFYKGQTGTVYSQWRNLFRFWTVSYLISFNWASPAFIHQNDLEKIDG